MLVSARPRLLFVSPRFLFPADEGGKIRTSNILRQMKGGAFHIALAMPTPADRAAFAGDIGAVCDELIAWPQNSPSRPRRLLALASRLPVSVATDRSRAGQAAVASALATRPDIVVTDLPHAAVLTPPRMDAASLLFTHNVETEIYERHARVAIGLWRLLWRDQAGKMARFEADLMRRYDAVIAVSARDAATLRERFGAANTQTITTGVDLDFFAAQPPPNADRPGNRIVFTGVMDSPANIDGVEFLIREIWPLVLAGRPDAQAVIVGRNPPPALVALARAQAPHMTLTGFVDDIRPYLAAADLAVIPLRVGGGTRIKAFESIAVGRPVVSTSVGIEGLDLVPGSHFLAADTPAQFASAILRLLNDAPLRQSLAETGSALLEARFSWAHVARQFEAICIDAARARETRCGAKADKA
jgi:glycosyltransferase involved in cell wall biosynthesis